MASERVEQLISQMTPTEKIGQLGMFADAFRPFAADFNPETMTWNDVQLKEMIRNGEVGSLFNGVGAINGLKAQKIAVEQSRLGIPLLFAADVIHGMRTVFPIPLGESASFDIDLARETARACAVEATAEGLHWTFAPMVDVARDQRWGRVAESAGEDTYLASAMAVARVRGFQGDDLRRDDAMLATPKHFAAYGAVLAGMEYNTVDMAPQTLREVHLPPFRAAFRAGALAVMSAFNDINGVPCTANRALLTDLLRDEWRFEGLVVSDYTSDMELIDHGYAADYPDAAAKSLNAGLDVSMQSAVYKDGLPVALRNGTVQMRSLDDAVRRVLTVKEALGLFDNPYRSLNPEVEARRDWITEHDALALRAAEESVVMLKNRHNVLPLQTTDKVALIGPFADTPESTGGCWNLFGENARNVGIAEGLRNAGFNVEIAVGCEPEVAIDGGIAQALEIAARNDVVVLCLGEPIEFSGESQSRTSIALPSVQLRLLKALKSTGKPLVVLLQNGRALAIDEWVDEVDAILVCWFLGTRMGDGIANLLTGKVSPSGRLPVSFPMRDGQQPYFYNHMSTGRPYREGTRDFRSRWREIPNEALFPFGFGLTFSAIEYGATQVDIANERIQVTCDVTNKGDVDVHEVVQLYTHDVVASRVRPVRELKGFERVLLQSGETRTMHFELTRDDLAFWNPQMQRVTEPGLFRVWIAPNCAAGTAAEIELQEAGD